ncbi:MAG: PH domain-containing protein [Coxiellaceae bacterium]|nr:PH domain-containing protein [Coxiellaceae bacterium]
MRYINNTLLNEEKVIFATHPHWIVFGSTGLCIVFAIVIWIFGAGTPALHIALLGWALYKIAALFFVVYAIYLGFYAMIRYKTSEYGVTNKRVIMKVGWIQRDAFDTFLTRVEGIKVWQSVLGRLLDYGTITVVGTGGTDDSFPQVPNPMQFRHIVQEQMDKEMKEFQTEQRRN